MAWGVLAIWAIVAVTLVWFIRDEQRRRHAARPEQAVVAATPAREAPAPSRPANAPRPHLSRADLAFIEALRVRGETARG